MAAGDTHSRWQKHWPVVLLRARVQRSGVEHGPYASIMGTLRVSQDDPQKMMWEELDQEKFAKVKAYKYARKVPLQCPSRSPSP